MSDGGQQLEEKKLVELMHPSSLTLVIILIWAPVAVLFLPTTWFWKIIGLGICGVGITMVLSHIGQAKRRAILQFGKLVELETEREIARAKEAEAEEARLLLEEFEKRRALAEKLEIDRKQHFLNTLGEIETDIDTALRRMKTAQMQGIDEVREAMETNSEFVGSMELKKIDGDEFERPVFKYDFSTLPGAQLRLYRGGGSMLSDVNQILQSGKCALLMQKSTSGEGEFVDREARLGKTYNYYAFLYHPIKTSEGKIVDTGMKLVYAEKEREEQDSSPSFLTVLPDEFIANIAHGFITERITIPGFYEEVKQAEIRAKKLDAKSVVRDLEEEEGDITARLDRVVDQFDREEMRGKELIEHIEKTLETQREAGVDDERIEQLEEELYRKAGL